MRMLIATAFVCLSLASSAEAQSVKSIVIASNGTQLTLYSDDFAQRYEYTAPSIDFEGMGGFALVAKVVKAKVTLPLEIVGSIMYRGEWRRYSAAILKGGESVDASFNDKDVVSCSGSRYGGCSLREGFSLKPTQAQIIKYSEGGVLQIQLRAAAGEAVLVSVPVAYIDAVNEVAKPK